MAASNLRRCGRCGRRLRSLVAAGDWNVTVEDGVVIEVICPGCQTPLKNIEAEVNRATLDYGILGDGRLIGRPKVGDDC